MTPRYPGGISQPRQRGRPRVEDRGAPVTTWLSGSQYQRLFQLAQHHTDGNVSALVRKILIVRLRDE